MFFCTNPTPTEAFSYFFFFYSLFHCFPVEWEMRRVWAPLFILSVKKKSIEMMRMIAKSWVKTAHWKPKCHRVEKKNYLIALKIRLIPSTGKVESILSADNSFDKAEGGSHVVLTCRRIEWKLVQKSIIQLCWQVLEAEIGYESRRKPV